MKLFVPQLQRTFAKASTDSDTPVREKAEEGLALLAKMQAAK
jgi:hypothetical protein